jgi:glycerol uptake facilitator protein
VNDVLGEFLGTMILITLGSGVVAGVVLNKTKAQNAGWMVITTGWAFAVMAGVYTARAVGAPGYINPVGPLAGVLTANLAVEKALAYAAAEVAGAFAGAVIVWLHYLPHWKETSDPAAKRAVFCTSPAIRNYPANVLSEAIATFVLVFVGTAVVEKGLNALLAEKGLGNALAAPLGGALVWGIGLSLGATTGYAINPARDLGPRLAHALLPIAGKGDSDWAYAWVPIVGPLLGGAAGALLAQAVITS